jgi:hypothetical protein
MIKSSADSRTTIIPIFYYAQPSELMSTNEEALRNYEKKSLYTPQTIKEWRYTLYHVTGISGFILEEGQR